MVATIYPVMKQIVVWSHRACNWQKYQVDKLNVFTRAA